jgi:hypothetical protein
VKRRWVGGGRAFDLNPTVPRFRSFGSLSKKLVSCLKDIMVLCAVASGLRVVRALVAGMQHEVVESAQDDSSLVPLPGKPPKAKNFPLVL